MGFQVPLPATLIRFVRRNGRRLVLAGVIALISGITLSVTRASLATLGASYDPTSKLSASQFIEARNSTLTTVFTLVGGIGLVGTLWLTWRQYLLSQSGQITDRFAKAIELLGSNRPTATGGQEANLEARLGAVFLLERIARDSLADHRQVIEVLAAYLRRHSVAKLEVDAGDPYGSEHVASSGPVSFMCQAVVFVIARLQRGHFDFAINLERTNISGCNLSGSSLRYISMLNCDMSDSLLAGCDLRESYIMGSRLQRAILNESDLSGADLSYADLTGAFLRDARLVNANLYGAKLDRAFVSGADFSGANFTGVDLARSRLSQEQVNSGWGAYVNTTST